MSSAATLIHQARRGLAARDFDLALERAEAALKSSPGSADALALRAEIRRRLEDLAGALADLDQAIRYDPGEPRFIGARAEIRRRLGDWRGAAKDAGRLVKLSPGDGAGYLSRAEALRAGGKLKEALLDARQAQRSDPHGSWAYAVEAKIRRAMGANKGALSAARRAVSADSNDGKARAWLAECLRATGLLSEAEAELDQALRLEPHCAWAYALRGQCRLEGGNVSGADVDFETAFQMDRQCSAAYDFLGSVSAGLARDPLCAWVYGWRGIARSRGGQPEKGLVDLKRAVSLDGRWAWMHARLGEASLMAGRTKLARRALDRAVALRPEDGRARFWRAEALRRIGDMEGAVADLNFVIHFQPNLDQAEHAPVRVFYGTAFIHRALAKSALSDRDGFYDDMARGLRLVGESLRGETLSNFKPEDRRTLLRNLRRKSGPDERAWRLRAEKSFRAGKGGSLLASVRKAMAAAPWSGILPLIAWRAQDPHGHGAPSNVSWLERAIALGMELPACYSWLGGALLDRGRRREGLENIARAVAMDPARAWEHASWPRNVSAKASARQSRNSLKAFSRLKRDPLNHYLRARLYQNLGRYDRAESELRLAGKLFSSCPDFVACALGEMLLKQGKMRPALEALERAVALGPKRARSLAWRAEARYWLGDIVGAERDFKAAVEAEPEEHWMHAWFGQFLLWTGRYAQAEKILGKAIALEPGHGWAYAWRGAAKFLRGGLRPAARDVDTAIRRDPGDVEALIWRGEIHLAAKEIRRALKCLDKAISEDPGRFWSYVVRGLARSERGDREGMFADYVQAGTIAPERLPNWISTARRPLAAVALRDLRRALRDAKGNRTLRRIIG